MIVVVGAGMAGLTAAGRLVDAGREVLVLDKGRSPGGRVATRRIGDAAFDHGAQHFGVRTPQFAQAIGMLRRSDVVHRWYDAGSGRKPNERYVGTRGMAGIAARLASGIDVRTATTVTHITRTSDGLDVHVDGKPEVRAQAAILTPPMPQLLALLHADEHGVPEKTRQRLEAVHYDACLAVMATLDGPSGLVDGHCSFSSGPIAWIGDNQHKGISAVPAITIHSSPEFAAAHLEDDPARWAKSLVDHAAPHLASAVGEVTAHRWRYAKPQHTLDVGALRLGDHGPIVLAGEVFSGAKVEGAFLSGLAAADLILGLR